MEHLLSALLDALADPTVSYIGLGYDATIGISTGKCFFEGGGGWGYGMQSAEFILMLVLFHSIAVHNSEPNSTFPTLSEYMQMKTLEENEGEGELLGFNAVATKLLGVVTAPIQSALNSKQTQVELHNVSNTLNFTKINNGDFSQGSVYNFHQWLMVQINQLVKDLKYPL